MALLWIFLAVLAAAAQLIRNLGQRQLVRDLPGRPALSRDVANAARYWVGLPLSSLALWALLSISPERPELGMRPILFSLLAAVGQIIATDLLIRLFQRRAFGIGVAYQKTENLLMALVGPIGLTGLLGLSVASDVLTFWDWLGLILATIGIVAQSFLSLDRKQREFDGISLLIGLACGLAFTVTGLCLAEAVRTLGLAQDTVVSAVLAGATILVLTQAIQSVIMAVWIQVRSPGEWAKLPKRAGGLLTIGSFSAIASLALFTAFGLQHPALVSVVKNVEIPLSIAVAYLLYREMPGRWEWLGMGLILISVLLITLF